jgi:hypothetical protein
MASAAAGDRLPPPLLSLGRIDRLQVQVGFRRRPTGTPYEQLLLDCPVSEDIGAAVDEARVLAALERILHTGAGAPPHYSVHQHRWHTSWGASPGALEIGLTGTLPAVEPARLDAVCSAFRELLSLAGEGPGAPTSRDQAIVRARTSTQAAYAVDADALSLNSEEHHAADNLWSLEMHSGRGEVFDVVVGLVDGYVGSVRARRRSAAEVVDSIGSE